LKGTKIAAKGNETTTESLQNRFRKRSPPYNLQSWIMKRRSQQKEAKKPRSERRTLFVASRSVPD
jgi:hypothetical protein